MKLPVLRVWQQVGASRFCWFFLPTKIPPGPRHLWIAFAKIGKAVNLVIPSVIAVSVHTSPRDGVFKKYGIEAVDFGCEFLVA